MKNSIEKGLLIAAGEAHHDDEFFIIGAGDYWALYKNNELINSYGIIEGENSQHVYNRLSKFYGFTLDNFEAKTGNDVWYNYFNVLGKFPSTFYAKFID